MGAEPRIGSVGGDGASLRRRRRDRRGALRRLARHRSARDRRGRRVAPVVAGARRARARPAAHRGAPGAALVRAIGGIARSRRVHPLHRRPRLLRHSHRRRGEGLRPPRRRDHDPRRPRPHPPRRRRGDRPRLPPRAPPVPRRPARSAGACACTRTRRISTSSSGVARPGAPSVVLLGGFSGHGYKAASAVGEVAAQLAVDGGSALDLAMFDPARFAPVD